jgi:RNA polymerase sigma-70 factor (ECF subfamily)
MRRRKNAGCDLRTVAGYAVKVAVHRARQRFRELLRAEVAHMVSRPDEIDGELRHLIAILSS